jgi:hypothetical protein
VDTPDLSWYIRRLEGLEGYAFREHLKHARVPELLNYIELLENELNGRSDMHEMQSI